MSHAFVRTLRNQLFVCDSSSCGSRAQKRKHAGYLGSQDDCPEDDVRHPLCDRRKRVHLSTRRGKGRTTQQNGMALNATTEQEGVGKTLDLSGEHEAQQYEIRRGARKLYASTIVAQKPRQRTRAPTGQRSQQDQHHAKDGASTKCSTASSRENQHDRSLCFCSRKTTQTSITRDSLKPSPCTSPRQKRPTTTGRT